MKGKNAYAHQGGTCCGIFPAFLHVGEEAVGLAAFLAIGRGFAQGRAYFAFGGADAAVFGGLEGLHVPSGDGKVRMSARLRVVIVGPAAVGILIVHNLINGFYDDLFQIGDGGDVHLLAEGVGFA